MLAKLMIVGMVLFFLFSASSAFPMEILRRVRNPVRPAAPASSVQSRAAIKGRITDKKTGRVIPRATLTISYQNGRIAASVNTDSNGNYSIDKRLSGVYVVKVQAGGYLAYSTLQVFRFWNTYTLNYSLSPIIKNSSPVITYFYPSNRSTYTCGDVIAMSVSARDPDNDFLEYRFILDNTILKNWSAANRFNYKTSLANRGRHRVFVEARDKKGGRATKNSSIYIFRQMPKPGK